MLDTGCDSVSFGVESGNPEMLVRIRKGITLEQVRRAVNLCNEVGILAHTSFIAGLPGESPETLADTKKFAASLGSLYGYHILAPFPGTTVRENLTDYDLQILTDDWVQYDANRAITRTSHLSPEAINAFVDDFEGEIMQVWEKQVRNYQTGANSPSEDLHVGGYFRTQLVYRLLSEDLIETEGQNNGALTIDKSRQVLCERIKKKTGSDGTLVEKTIGDFIGKGYIKTRKEKETLNWYWTHNNKVDVLP